MDPKPKPALTKMKARLAAEAAAAEAAAAPAATEKKKPALTKMKARLAEAAAAKSEAAKPEAAKPEAPKAPAAKAEAPKPEAAKAPAAKAPAAKPALTKMKALMEARQKELKLLEDAPFPETPGQEAAAIMKEYCLRNNIPYTQADIDACLDWDKQLMTEYRELERAVEKGRAAVYGTEEVVDENGEVTVVAKPKPEFGTREYWAWAHKNKKERLAREAAEAAEKEKKKAEAIARGETPIEEKPKKKRGPNKPKTQAKEVK